MRRLGLRNQPLNPRILKVLDAVSVVSQRVLSLSPQRNNMAELHDSFLNRRDPVNKPRLCRFEDVAAAVLDRFPPDKSINGSRSAADRWTQPTPHPIHRTERRQRQPNNRKNLFSVTHHATC
jgi:hypothetical protein